MSVKDQHDMCSFTGSYVSLSEDRYTRSYHVPTPSQVGDSTHLVRPHLISTVVSAGAVPESSTSTDQRSARERVGGVYRCMVSTCRADQLQKGWRYVEKPGLKHGYSHLESRVV